VIRGPHDGRRIAGRGLPQARPAMLRGSPTGWRTARHQQVSDAVDGLIVGARLERARVAPQRARIDVDRVVVPRILLPAKLTADQLAGGSGRSGPLGRGGREGGEQSEKLGFWG